MRIERFEDIEAWAVIFASEEMAKKLCKKQAWRVSVIQRGETVADSRKS